MMGKALNLIRQRFGRLVALKPIEKRNGKIVWLCECDCGNFCKARSDSLMSKNTQSCGCLQKELAVQRGKNRFTHNMSQTSIYKIWGAMIQRCENPNDRRFADYGGRGIKVCDHWHSFENFYADVGDRPEGMTLDRWPDNNGNYELDNFRWATPQEQILNSRPKSCGSAKQRWFYGHGPNGEMIIENNQSHVARIFGLSHANISNCLHGKLNHHHGWTFQWIPEQGEAIYD